MKWRAALGDTIESAPALGADGTIVCGTSNNALYALRADGTLPLRATLGDWADSSAFRCAQSRARGTTP